MAEQGNFKGFSDLKAYLDQSMTEAIFLTLG
jgi:hypothetical protein